MKGPALRPGWEDITWRGKVAPCGRRTPSTQNVKSQTSNLDPENVFFCRFLRVFNQFYSLD